MLRPSGRAMVSTLREAEVFADAGVTDMAYGVGVAPDKLDRVLALRARGVDLAVILDCLGPAARQRRRPSPSAHGCECCPTMPAPRPPNRIAITSFGTGPSLRSGRGSAAGEGCRKRPPPVGDACAQAARAKLTRFLPASFEA